MENLGFHSKPEFSYNWNENTIDVEDYVIIMCAKFSFIKLMVSEKKSFKFENLSFLSPWQPVKLRHLDKNLIELFSNYSMIISVKQNPNIPLYRKMTIFNFSHYTSMENISHYSNQSSYESGTKTQLIVPPTLR